MKVSQTFFLGAVLGALASLAPACGPAKMPCNSTTCSGCCDSTGFCQFGFDNQGCGTAGNVCQACGLGTSSALTTGGTVDDTVWSPDGSQLAIVSDWRVDETYELALISSLTSLSTPTPLVTPVFGGDVLDAQWTP